MNDNISPPVKTVSEQVFEAFYKALEAKSDLADIAARFRGETSRTETAIRKILFNEEE